MNIELVGADCATEDEIIEATKDADAIMTEGAKIKRKIMEELPNLMKCAIAIKR